MKMKTGERIKLTRKEKHISAEEIAAAANVSPATIYRYENGEIADVPPDKVEAIAEALDTTVPYLTGRLKKTLHTFDIQIKDRGSEGFELIDTTDPDVSARYSRGQWRKLQERNDFKRVWHDLHNKEDELAPELKSELDEIAELFRALTPEQKEQARSFLRFLKDSGGTR